MKRPYHFVLRHPEPCTVFQYTVWDAYSNDRKVGAFIHKKGQGLRFYPDRSSYSMPEMAKITAMTEEVERICKYLTLKSA